MKITYELNERGCHICTSHKKDKFGYPRMGFNGINTPMGRYIYAQKFGKIKKGLLIRHKCDTPACINIDHLELGTIQDNVRDRHERGRTSKAPRTNGEINGMSKLKKEDIIFIRNNIKKFPQKKLGEMFGIQQASVSAIQLGKTWKHLGVVNG